MKSKVIFMALLALAFTAQAELVSVENAKLAARAWVCRGEKFRAKIGDTVESAVTHLTDAKIPFYAVKMKGGGIVFMSSDTEVEPVICFTSDPDAGVELDPKSPLWALLNADLSSRAGSTAAQLSRRAKLWADLIREGSPDYIPPSFAAAPAITDQKRINDLRVAPLVKSQWSQSTTSRGLPCWNYYTPPGPESNALNAVCGCVATAMSQVMRYHKFPDDEVEPVTHECTYNETPTNLTTQAGMYDWDAMTLTPNLSSVSMTAENYQAIGKLTSDAGITVFMNYGSDGSGAFGFDITYALMEHWHYKNSVFFDMRDLRPQETGHANRDKAFQQTLFANFDAGYPVCMGIPGHAIVADGYGFNDGIDYVHLNMGWAGQSDYWYNLPDMTRANRDFNAVSDINYNIFPDKDNTYGIISGRLTDAETGAPSVNAVVTLRASDGTEVTVRTTETGVYGAAVKVGAYAISAVSSDGAKSGEITGKVVVKAPAPELVNWNQLGRLTPTVKPTSELGNSWGNDLSLEESVYAGSVTNVTQGTSHATLDAALDAANADDAIEILSATLLRQPKTITKNVSIRTADGVDPEAAVVICREASAHGFTCVTNGATLALENVVFTNTTDCFVHVYSNAFLSVSGKVKFWGGAHVRTEDATGVVLSGELTSPLTVDCRVATGIGQQFGTCPGGAFEDSAKNLLNPHNDELSGLVSGGRLIWGVALVPAGDAVAKMNGQNFRSLRTLFSAITNDATVEIVRNCVLSNAVEVSHRLTLQGNSAVTISVGDFAEGTDIGAFFTVTSSMTVNGVKFDGSKLTYARGRKSLFHLKDEASELVLGPGAVIAGFKVVNEALDGVVVVSDGRLEMQDGSCIEKCRDATDNIRAVNLYGTFDFKGGRIVDGGVGVYVWENGKVNFSGSATVTKNFDTDGKRSNVVVVNPASMILAGDDLSGEIGVSVLEAEDEQGELFGVVGQDVTAFQGTAAHFVNDGNAKLRGSVAEGYLMWDEVPPPPPVPVVRVTSGGETVEFGTVDEAFAAVKGDAVIELLQDVTFSKPISISTNVFLFSTNRFALARYVPEDPQGGVGFISKDPYIQIADGASLVVSNVTVNGRGDVLVDSVSSGSLFFVRGGELTLDDAVVSNFYGSTGTSAAAIQVLDAIFTMRNGAVVCECANPYLYDDAELDYIPSHCGGVLAYNSVLCLQGGEICGCAGAETGAIGLMDNESVVEVSGDMRIWDNYLLVFDGFNLPAIGQAANLLVNTADAVRLAGDMFDDALICVQESVFCESVGKFGYVDPDYLASAAPEALAAGAACFIHEVDGTNACVVTNGDASVALLVWATALDDGVYTDPKTQEKYGEIKIADTPTVDPSEGPSIDPSASSGSSPAWSVVTNTPTPIALKSMRCVSGSQWELVFTNRVEFCNYRLIWTDNLAKGFTSTGAWEHAVGPAADPVWTTNVLMTGSGSWFWRAEGTEGTNMVPPQVEQ